MFRIVVYDNSLENGAFMLTNVPGKPGYFHEIRPDHYFYVSDKSELVICFDKYEVAAGFMGKPEFVIPTEIISDMLSSDLVN